MKKIFKKTTGFTLIELLVVIGILGILASAMVATIDPFEQLKKGNDANSKNTAVEFVNGVIRYYTTHNAMPWSSSAANCNSGALPSSSNLTSAAMIGCLSALISDNELKPGFTTVTDVLKTIVVTDQYNTPVACFQPQSKSQQKDKNTIYDATGAVLANVCTGNGGTALTCYWCAK